MGRGTSFGFFWDLPGFHQKPGGKEGKWGRPSGAVKDDGGPRYHTPCNELPSFPHCFLWVFRPQRMYKNVSHCFLPTTGGFLVWWPSPYVYFAMSPWISLLGNLRYLGPNNTRIFLDEKKRRPSQRLNLTWLFCTWQARESWRLFLGSLSPLSSALFLLVPSGNNEKTL